MTHPGQVRVTVIREKRAVNIVDNNEDNKELKFTSSPSGERKRDVQVVLQLCFIAALITYNEDDFGLMG